MSEKLVAKFKCLAQSGVKNPFFEFYVNPLRPRYNDCIHMSGRGEFTIYIGRGIPGMKTLHLCTHGLN